MPTTPAGLVDQRPAGVAGVDRRRCWIIERYSGRLASGALTTLTADTMPSVTFTVSVSARLRATSGSRRRSPTSPAAEGPWRSCQLRRRLRWRDLARRRGRRRASWPTRRGGDVAAVGQRHLDRRHPGDDVRIGRLSGPWRRRSRRRCRWRGRRRWRRRSAPRRERPVDHPPPRSAPRRGGHARWSVTSGVGSSPSARLTGGDGDTGGDGGGGGDEGDGAKHDRRVLSKIGSTMPGARLAPQLVVGPEPEGGVPRAFRPWLSVRSASGRRTPRTRRGRAAGCRDRGIAARGASAAARPGPGARARHGHRDRRPQVIDFQDYDAAQIAAIMALALILYEGGLSSGWAEIRPVIGQSIALATRRHDPDRGADRDRGAVADRRADRARGADARLDRGRHRRRGGLRGPARIDAAAAARADAGGRVRRQRPDRDPARDRLHRGGPASGLRRRRRDLAGGDRAGDRRGGRARGRRARRDRPAAA